MEIKVERALKLLNDATQEEIPKPGAQEHANRKKMLQELAQRVSTQRLEGTIRCRPWDFADFTKRVRTFKPMTWFGKPLALSPPECARYGWANVAKDTLFCNCCKVQLGKTDKGVEGASATVDTITPESLSSAHDKLCPWFENPCPESFLLQPPSSRSSQIANLIERVLTLLPLLATGEHPSITLPPPFAGLFEIEGLEDVANLASKAGVIKGNEEYEKAHLGAAVTVALCGWTARSGGEAVRKGLYCAACDRSLGLWNFEHIKPVNNTAGEIISEGQSSATKRKRDVSPLQPLIEHQPYCIWVREREKEGKEQQKPGWSSALEALAATAAYNREGYGIEGVSPAKTLAMFKATQKALGTVT